MSPLTAILVLSVSAALLTVGCGMPHSSNIFFPDDADQTADQTAERTAPRHNRQRWAARRLTPRPRPPPSTGRNFYFPDEEVETQRPPIVPDSPTGRPSSQVSEPSVKPDQPAVTPDQTRVKPDRRRPSAGQGQGAGGGQAVVTDSPPRRPDWSSPDAPTPTDSGAVIPDSPVPSDSGAVIPDGPVQRPSDSGAVIPDSPVRRPSDSGVVIPDSPVRRPSDSWPEWPSRTPHRPFRRPGDKTVPEEETEDSKPEPPVEPTTTSGSGSSSGNSSVSGSSGSSPEWFPIPSCGNVKFSAYNNATGVCVKLWTVSEAGCEPGSWFVVDPMTREASCLPRPCPAGEAMFDDVCWSISDAENTVCAAGQGVLLDQFGYGLCDCLKLQVYWPEEARCYPVYQRGPCAAGEHLVVPPTGTRAVCEPTPCRDGEVLWEDPELGVPLRCYSTPQFRDDDPCAIDNRHGGQLRIDPQSLNVTCQFTQLNSVWDLPQSRCPAGSFLDFSGQCREELEQKFRSSFASQPASRSSLCPSGFTVSPAGRCVNTGLVGGSRGIGR